MHSNHKKGFVARALSRLRRTLSVHFARDEKTREQARQFARWFADEGDKTLRLNYPTLDANSVVFDLGGYVGDFAEAIHQKYASTVYVFEPHPKFFAILKERFSENAKIIPLNFGIADMDGEFTLSDSLDGSSILNPHHSDRPSVNCIMREYFSVLSELDVERIDLMKINIEGAEFPLLEHIAAHNRFDAVRNYQIQFHNFAQDAERRVDLIRAKLAETHKQTWSYNFVWENWTAKT